MKTGVQRHRKCLSLLGLIALVLGGLSGLGLIEAAHAQPNGPEVTLPPVFGPMQLVVCKAKAALNDERYFTVILPHTGLPDSFGWLLSPLLDCGPFPEPDLSSAATERTPRDLTLPPVFGPTQFVVCKAKAGLDDERYFTVILPHTALPQGFGWLLTPLLNCGPFAEGS